MYCRFCTRKRVTMDRDGWDAPSHNDERMIQYVREHAEIRDVIVSGGDPLSLPMGKLRWFVTQLAAIDHLDVIRIGTRVPVTLAPAAVRSRVDRPAARRRQDLDSNAFQPSPRNHPRNRPRRPQPGECRHAGQQPRGAAQGSERLGGHHAHAGPRTAADQGPALLPVPLRSGRRGRALPHFGLEGAGDHRGAAGPRLRAGRADLRGRRHARSRQDSADAQLPDLGLRKRRRAAELRRA